MKQQKNTELPLYMKIAGLLRQQIFDGVMVPGDVLPAEWYLCELHNASRDTIRKALACLESEKLIYSRPKVGYFVSPPRHSEFLLNFPEETEGSTVAISKAITLPASEELQRILKLDAKQTVLKFTQINYLEEKPVSYDTKFIPSTRSYPIMDMDSQYAAVGPVALNVAPYDYYIELKVSAAIADAELADILLCKEGDPLLLVRRTYIKRDGTPLSYNYRYLRQDIELFGRSDFRTEES